MRGKTYTLIGGGIALTMLGGCLGTDNPDFNKQAFEAAQFVNQLSSLPVTADGDMPVSGSAEYRGVAAFSYDVPLTTENRDVDMYADMTLNADFDSNSVTGNISSFNSANGNVSGAVNLSDGAIASNLMQANGAGTITDGDTQMDLNLRIAGTFRSEDAGVVTGGISGTYTPEGESTGLLFGTFGVDQN